MCFPQDCEVHLTIISDIENVNIFIDDSLAGTGKNVNVILSKGQYKIVALENSDRWDAKTFIDSIPVITLCACRAPKTCRRKHLMKQSLVVLKKRKQLNRLAPWFVAIQPSFALFMLIWIRLSFIHEAPLS